MNYVQQYLPIFIAAGLAFVLGRLTDKISRNRERDKRITELEKNQAVMTEQAKPIAAAFLALSIDKLTHFHTPETDKILAKIEAPFNQTEEEINELAVAMQERMEDVSGEIDEAEKIHAKILPDLIRLAKLEQHEDTSKVELMLVKKPVTEQTKSEDVVNDK